MLPGGMLGRGGRHRRVALHQRRAGFRSSSTAGSPP